MRRPQFSLRTLLIVVTLLAIPCWYVGEQWRIVQHRKAMLRRLDEIGGSTWVAVGHPGVPWIRSLFGDEGVLAIVYPAKCREPEAEREIEEAFPEAKNEERLYFGSSRLD